jgi:hypothetical protein
MITADLTSQRDRQKEEKILGEEVRGGIDDDDEAEYRWEW